MGSIDGKFEVLYSYLNYLEYMQITDPLRALNHSLEQLKSINGNHVTMCKFGNQSEGGYQSVKKAVIEILQHSFISHGK